MKIYYLQPFAPDAFGHGGEKRSFQIEALMHQLGLNVEYLQLNQIIQLSRFSRFYFLLRNLRFIFSLQLKINSIRYLQRLSLHLMAAKSQIPTVESGSVIFYEHSIRTNWFIPLLLAQKGCKIIAFPHNLESLVPDQISGLGDVRNPHGFSEEILVLKHASLVLSISKEENWLLNLWNIPSLYYPYVPSAEETVILKSISAQRSKRKRNKQFLIFGSVGNPPTFWGMVQLLRFLQKNHIPGDLFHIVGFHSERLKEEIEFSSVFQFHGSVSTKELYRLYAEVDAAIIHQTPSTGALTKIPELLLSGVPVICNAFAARNYFGFSGVTVYYTLGELPDILEKEMNEKTLSFQPDANIDQVCEAIQQILN